MKVYRVKANKFHRVIAGRVHDLLAADYPTALTANKTLTAKDAGATFKLGAASGLTVTLPEATGSGKRFRFVVSVAVTENAYIIKAANATDKFQGVLFASTDDTASKAWVADNNAHDYITMNGSTQGGLIGSEIVVEDVAANTWHASGQIVSSGTVVTPFAST